MVRKKTVIQQSKKNRKQKIHLLLLKRDIVKMSESIGMILAERNEVSVVLVIKMSPKKVKELINPKEGHDQERSRQKSSGLLKLRSTSDILEADQGQETGRRKSRRVVIVIDQGQKIENHVMKSISPRLPDGKGPHREKLEDQEDRDQDLPIIDDKGDTHQHHPKHRHLAMQVETAIIVEEKEENHRYQAQEKRAEDQDREPIINSIHLNKAM